VVYRNKSYEKLPKGMSLGIILGKRNKVRDKVG
jgi:hypothetical protein